MHESTVSHSFHGSKLVETFYRMAETAIDRVGVYPQIAIAVIDGQTNVMSLALDGYEVWRAVNRLFAPDRPAVQELVFGLDRSTKPGQGTEFADVLTLLHYDGKTWTPGVINYQDQPRVVRPIDWDNPFWNAQLRKELAQHNCKEHVHG